MRLRLLLKMLLKMLLLGEGGGAVLARVRPRPQGDARQLYAHPAPALPAGKNILALYSKKYFKRNFLYLPSGPALVANN